MTGKTDNRERLQELIGSDYTLQWIIGHGGMSTVWLADDNRYDREVAIKVLRPEFSDNDEFLGRFRNEATAAESIDSDNVVRTYDYREIDDPAGQRFCFIAMEYIRGESLADMLARENSLPESLALDVMEQAAHGLSIIHRMGLVHRDIKPGNLLITQNGQVKITDFGIAKAAAAVPLTRTGMVVGTAQYVSPEQAQGQRVTPASDVYSLGVVAYEMLAGERPFTGDSSVSVALAHINQNPDPLSTLISAPARDLIGITLRKDPATRYRDGNELALAVSKVRFGQRPPQTASADLNAVAEEPSPTASTVMLGNTTHPTTTHPAPPRSQAETQFGSGPAPRPGTNPDAQPLRQPVGGNAGAQRPAPRQDTAPRRRSNSGSGRSFGLGMFIALLAVALVGGGFLLANYLNGDKGASQPQPTTTKEKEVVTEWVDPSTEESPEPTTETVTPETQEATPTETYEEETGQGEAGSGSGSGNAGANDGSTGSQDQSGYSHRSGETRSRWPRESLETGPNGEPRRPVRSESNDSDGTTNSHQGGGAAEPTATDPLERFAERVGGNS